MELTNENVTGNVIENVCTRTEALKTLSYLLVISYSLAFITIQCFRPLIMTDSKSFSFVFICFVAAIYPLFFCS